MNDKPSAILDTCVLVDILRNKKKDLQERINALDIRKCAIADLSVFELLCGAEKSLDRDHNIKIVNSLLSTFRIIPTVCGYKLAAEEKNRLQSSGTPIEDIDLLIGCTCSQEEIPLVTSNIKHHQRISGLNIINW